jgi:mono/diheme cytochrome c family protein
MSIGGVIVESKLRRSVIRWATLVALAGLLLIADVPQLQAENTLSSQNKQPAQSDVRWTKVTVQLPTNVTLLPAGQGAEIANSQCLICHSADMVLYQPDRTQEQWKETINKMRTAYGAPLPTEQVDVLATYLSQLKP